MPKNTDAASQLSKKPTPTSNGEDAPKTWTVDEKRIARDQYSVNILEANCPIEKSKDKSLPTSAYVVEYTQQNKLQYDIVIAGKKSNIFDFYWDRLKEGLLDIRWASGTKNPNLWGNPTPPKKRKKKE